MWRVTLLIAIIVAAGAGLIGFYRHQPHDPLLTGDAAAYAGTWSMVITPHGAVGVPPVRPGPASQPLPAVGSAWTTVQGDRGAPDLLTAPDSATPIAWYWHGDGDAHLRLDLRRAHDGSLRVAAVTTFGRPDASGAQP